MMGLAFFILLVATVASVAHDMFTYDDRLREWKKKQ